LFSALKRLLRRRGGDVRHPRTQRGIL
jgi:hypothetical protein